MSLLHASCLYEFCCTTNLRRTRYPEGYDFQDVLSLIQNSIRLRILDLKFIGGPNLKPGRTELVMKHSTRWPPLEELRLNGPLSGVARGLLSQICIDWDRLQRLKVSPLSKYWDLFHTCQRQLANLTALSIGFNGTEQVSVLGWCGDIGPLFEDYSPPLYYSSLLDLEEMTSLLLAKGADPNAHGGRFEYPLQATAYSGNIGIAQLLLAHGADVNARSRIFGNALQAATCRRNRPIIDLLVAHGAELASPGVMFDNVVQIALHLFDADLISHFILEGAPIQAPKCTISRRRPARLVDQEERDIELEVQDVTESVESNTSRTEYSLGVFAAGEKSSWTGWYASAPDLIRQEFSFSIVTTSHELGCGEAHFQGTGTDSVGRSTLNGRMNSTGHMGFVKLYPSVGWIYSGKLQADGNTLAGRWGAPGSDFGTFQFSKTIVSL
ncbi:hypothetical protein MMC13_002923 [Lambiella insularis]|nr:hypothetical protein [Lambiella insularis]